MALIRVATLLLCAFAATVQAGTHPFYRFHPDWVHREVGMEAYQTQRYDIARQRFEWAARYGDKTAQYYLALMYRDGHGGPTDLAMAYAWCDLAAERGYKAMLVDRERIWSNLDAADRARAIEIGRDLYKEYGDAVAMPRMKSLIRRGANWFKIGGGAHTGYNKAQAVAQAPPPLGYFAEEYWDAEEYARIRDEEWRPRGRVEVGPLQVAPASRIKTDD